MFNSRVRTEQLPRQYLIRWSAIYSVCKPHNMHIFWLAAMPVFIPFSDTECVFWDCVFLDVALLGEGLFHLMTIGTNTLNSSQATSSFRNHAPALPYLTLPSHYSNPTLPYPVNDILTNCSFSYFPTLMFWGCDLVLIASVRGHCLSFNTWNIVIL